MIICAGPSPSMLDSIDVRVPLPRPTMLSGAPPPAPIATLRPSYGRYPSIRPVLPPPAPYPHASLLPLPFEVAISGSTLQMPLMI